nr:MAG TPA: hypothetical protein [Caudoviricetes sp.]DAS64345.1 MAG TPA: hypothetical protein [Caudoviricetes sp.]
MSVLLSRSSVADCSFLMILLYLGHYPRHIVITNNV